MSIQKNLASLAEQEIQERNLINHFLPFRQQRNRPVNYDFDAIAGDALSTALKTKLTPKYDIETFTEKSLSRLKAKLSDDSLHEFISQMYFKGEGLYKVSPEFLLFKSSSAEVGGSKHISRLIRSFLAANECIFPKLTTEVNFLEAELVSELQSNLTTYSPSSNEHPYLPFLADMFTQDFEFLCRHPNYLLQNTRSFFGLYTFLYSAQLALNINEWDTPPNSKPLYFILDTEKASIERKQVRDTYPWLKKKVADLFPVLSMLEYFNQPQDKEADRYPLWMFTQYVKMLKDKEYLDALGSMSTFAGKYCEKRGLKVPKEYPEKLQPMVKLLTGFAQEIFNKSRSSQFTVNSRVVSAFENEIANHFIQARGRSGRVLILNQDYLLLLTNLAVGSQDQLQLQQLLKTFKQRGIWFDRQSEQALINFYERIGNIERMSDSGDAVYVRKTL